MQLPKFTAEMARDPVLCIESQFLVQNEQTGKPELLKLEPVQKAMLRDLYPLELEGLPRARDALLTTVKKWGKSTLLAALAFYTAIRRKHSEVYALATTREQAKAVLYDKLEYAVTQHPYWNEYSDIKGYTITFPSLGSIIRYLPNNYRAVAGLFPDGVFVDELWAFMLGSDQRAFNELVIPPQKQGCRFLTSYAGFEGESVLLEKYWALAELGESQHEDYPIRYYAEASLWSFIDQGQAAWRMPWMAGPIWEAYIANLQNDPVAYSRFGLNEWTTSAARFIEGKMWDDLAEPEVRLKPPGEEERVFLLAADAATKRDCVALVGCAWNDDLARVEVCYSQIWETNGDFDLRVLGDEIVRIHEDYLGLMLEAHYDPYEMSVISKMLGEKGVEMVEFTQTTRRTKADTALRDLIVGKQIAHLGDPVLNRHMTNAVMVETRRGKRLAKEKTTLKIDGAVAVSMGAEAAKERLGYEDVVRGAANPFYSS